MFLLQHKDIPGDANAGQFTKCVKLDSIQFTNGKCGKNIVGNPDIFSGYGSTIIGEIHCTKFFDSATAHLIRESLKDNRVSVKIICLETNNRPYFTIEMENCLINKHEIIGHGYPALEKFYLTFSKIEYRYLPSGWNPFSVSYDLISGKLI